MTKRNVISIARARATARRREYAVALTSAQIREIVEAACAVNIAAALADMPSRVADELESRAASRNSLIDPQWDGEEF